MSKRRQELNVDQLTAFRYVGKAIELLSRYSLREQIEAYAVWLRLGMRQHSEMGDRQLAAVFSSRRSHYAQPRVEHAQRPVVVFASPAEKAIRNNTKKEIIIFIYFVKF